MRLAEHIYRTTSTFPTRETYALANQLQSAAVSIPSNLAKDTQKHDQGLSAFHLHCNGSLAELKHRWNWQQDWVISLFPKLRIFLT